MDQKMDPRAPDASPRTASWVRWVLFASVALNLAVVGAVVGSFGRDRWHPPPMDNAAEFGAFGMTPYAAALPPDQRQSVGREFVSEFRKVRPERDAVRQSFEQLIVAIRAEPFDRVTAAAEMDRQRAALAKMQEIGQSVLLDHLEAMTSAERSAYADALQQALRRGGRRHRD